MIDVEIPGWKSARLECLVLDVNGTLAIEGVLIDSVPERIDRLRRMIEVRLVSADTFGQLEAIATRLSVVATRLRPGEPEAAQKSALVRELGAERVVAIGNGANDAAMLAEAALGIVVLGSEGAATAALAAADVVATSIDRALDLLLHPRRLVATLRR